MSPENSELGRSLERSSAVVMSYTLRRAVFFTNGVRCEDLPRSLGDIRPVNILFLTSVRDTGTCDRNGTLVRTRGGLRYMEGAIERTVRKTYPGQALDGIARVVGVITDDMERDMRVSDYPVRPEPDRPWIYPLDLATPDGQRLAERTFHIPSAFRGLSKDAVEGRRVAKLKFERAVFATMQELRADVLVSDHYMAKIEFLIGELGLFGRVLNIHPAVTVKDHPFCFRGPTPTKDAIARAREDRAVKTGATLHVVNPVIDDGPPLAYVGDTPVYPDDEPQWLRWRNYQRAKLPLFIAGLRHYVQWIYPYLGKIDLSQLHPAQG